MATSLETRREMARTMSKLPEYSAARRLLREYRELTGDTQETFAAKVKYSRTAINNFECGSFDSAVLRFRIARFISEHPAGDDGYKPAGQLYDTADVRLLQAKFNFVLERGRCGAIEGEPGMGKTGIIRRLIHDLTLKELQRADGATRKRAIHVYCPIRATEPALIERIAQRVGTISRGKVNNVVRNIANALKAAKSILVLDEAQHLDVHCMEKVRELYDEPPHCGLLFLGSHQFTRTLTVQAPYLEQLNRRFHFLEQMKGLSEAEATEIVAGELGHQATRNVTKFLVEQSRPKSKGYISAARLFDALADLKQEAAKKEQVQ